MRNAAASQGRLSRGAGPTSMLRIIRRQRHRLRYPIRYRLLAELRAVASRSIGDLQLHQQHAFDEIVRFASAHTAFYRQRLGPRLAPTGPIDPTSLPILTKSDIRAAAPRMLSEQADRAAVRQGYTGGSTGEPLMPPLQLILSAT